MRRAVTLVPLLLAGCTVGPNYHAPTLTPPPAYGEGDPAQSAQPGTDLQGWWHAYADPELDRLVAIALADGLDVKLAQTRIAQARAQERVARSQFFPQLNANATVNSQRFSKNAGISSLAGAFGGGAGAGGSSGSGGVALPGGFITTYALGFDASWEADVFGGVRRQVEGARARTEAATWNARDAQVSLVAEVVDDYMAVRLAQEREAVARQEVDRQTRNLQIMGENAQVGLVPQGDTIRQRAQLAQAQASVGPIVAEGKAQMHALAVLIGKAPDAMIVELSVARPQLAAPPPMPAGLPSELLRRRPDVRAAERTLAAATADIGVAVADLYPRFNLMGMAQLISTSLGNLFSLDSAQAMGTLGATFPILDFGRRRGTIVLRKAQADEAYLHYQQTVLSALRDVEDALIRLRTEQQRNEALRSGVTDAVRGAQAVEARYRTGLTDLTTVLDAQASVLSNRDQLAQSDAQLRRSLGALYKALGGGWEGMPAADGPIRGLDRDHSAPRGR